MTTSLGLFCQFEDKELQGSYKPIQLLEEWKKLELYLDILHLGPIAYILKHHEKGERIFVKVLSSGKFDFAGQLGNT